LAKVIFNGTTKLIQILPGVSDINVISDLYSEWKLWVIREDNSKYPQAFRTFGGDDTSGSQVAPQYFFLTNGWRILIDGNDTDYVIFATNLYTDENDTPFVLTNGAQVSNKLSDSPVVSVGANSSALTTEQNTQLMNLTNYDDTNLINKIDDIPQNVWEYVNRSLTNIGVDVQFVNGIPVDLSDFNNHQDILDEINSKTKQIKNTIIANS